MKKLILITSFLVIGLSASAQKVSKPKYAPLDTTITVQSGLIIMHVTKSDIAYVRSMVLNADNVLGEVKGKLIKNNVQADIIIAVLKDRK